MAPSQTTKLWLPSVRPDVALHQRKHEVPIVHKPGPAPGPGPGPGPVVDIAFTRETMPIAPPSNLTTTAAVSTLTCEITPSSAQT